MVEHPISPYDQDVIPLVHASVVSIDEELDSDYTVHAVAAPSPDTTTISTASILEPGHLREEVDSSNHISQEEHQRSRQCNCGFASGSDRDQTWSTISSETSHHCHCPSDISSTSNHQAEERHVSDEENEHAAAAGAAGAVFGLFFGGPFMAVVFGLGTAHYSHQRGPVGDVARAMGDLALATRDKAAREFERRQHRRQQHEEQQNRRHDHDCFKRKFVELVILGWRSTLDFVQRNHLIERGAEQLKRLLDHAVEKMEASQSHRTSETNRDDPPRQ